MRGRARLWVGALALLAASCEKEPPVVLENESRPIDRLRYVEFRDHSWLILFGSEFDGKWVPKIELVRQLRKDPMRIMFAQAVAPGERFPPQGKFKERFRFVRFEERVGWNPRLNVNESLKIAIYEDLKVGRQMEVPNRLPRARREEFVVSERVAVLEFEDEAGESTTLEVLEGGSFELPADQAGQPYRVQLVEPERVVIDWAEEGLDQEVEILVE